MNGRLKLSGTTWSDVLGSVTPTVITVPGGERFRWTEEDGCYRSELTGGELYIEPDDNDGTLSPYSYYELPVVAEGVV